MVNNAEQYIQSQIFEAEVTFGISQKMLQVKCKLKHWRGMSVEVSSIYHRGTPKMTEEKYAQIAVELAMAKFQMIHQDKFESLVSEVPPVITEAEMIGVANKLERAP